MVMSELVPLSPSSFKVLLKYILPPVDADTTLNTVSPVTTTGLLKIMSPSFAPPLVVITDPPLITTFAVPLVVNSPTSTGPLSCVSPLSLLSVIP